MFGFTIKYLGFLKFIPVVPLIFDSMLRFCTLLTKPELLDSFDDISARVSGWPGVSECEHKYGGMQFNCRGKQIGHIHSNGLLDMPLSRRKKRALMADGKVKDHHSFVNSGWISFYIRDETDMEYAITLLRIGYERIISPTNGRRLESYSVQDVELNKKSRRSQYNQ